MGRVVWEWRLMEVKFNSYSSGSNGKPKRLHTFWELKKLPESKMKVDSQNPGEINRSEELSTSLILSFPSSKSQVSEDLDVI